MFFRGVGGGGGGGGGGGNLTLLQNLCSTGKNSLADTSSLNTFFKRLSVENTLESSWN